MKDEWKSNATCDTCGNKGIVGVAAMPGIPGSFAYCRACLDANAHPYGMVVANTGMINGLEHAADWWKEMVTGTIARLAITSDQFNQDVAAWITEFNAELERWAESND